MIQAAAASSSQKRVWWYGGYGLNRRRRQFHGCWTCQSWSRGGPRQGQECHGTDPSKALQNEHKWERYRSQSSPPRWVSPAVALTSKILSSMVRRETSKVPPPRSKIKTLRNFLVETVGSGSGCGLVNDLENVHSRDGASILCSLSLWFVEVGGDGDYSVVDRYSEVRLKEGSWCGSRPVAPSGKWEWGVVVVMQRLSCRVFKRVRVVVPCCSMSDLVEISLVICKTRKKNIPRAQAPNRPSSSLVLDVDVDGFWQVEVVCGGRGVAHAFDALMRWWSWWSCIDASIHGIQCRACQPCWKPWMGNVWYPIVPLHYRTCVQWGVLHRKHYRMMSTYRKIIKNYLPTYCEGSWQNIPAPRWVGGSVKLTKVNKSRGTGYLRRQAEFSMHREMLTRRWTWYFCTPSLSFGLVITTVMQAIRITSYTCEENFIR